MDNYVPGNWAAHFRCSGAGASTVGTWGRHERPEEERTWWGAWGLTAGTRSRDELIFMLVQFLPYHCQLCLHSSVAALSTLQHSPLGPCTSISVLLPHLKLRQPQLNRSNGSVCPSSPKAATCSFPLTQASTHPTHSCSLSAHSLTWQLSVSVPAVPVAPLSIDTHIACWTCTAHRPRRQSRPEGSCIWTRGRRFPSPEHCITHPL